MDLPANAGVLGLLFGGLILYVIISIGSRRVLFSWLNELPERSSDADQSPEQDERRCPIYGAINKRDFEKCYDCGDVSIRIYGQINL